MILTREVAIAVGVVSMVLFFVPLRGLPRLTSTVRQGNGPLDNVFYLILAVGSISLLFLGISVRPWLASMEPTRSNRALLEVISSVAMLMAIAPVIALTMRLWSPGEGETKRLGFLRPTGKVLLRFGASLLPLLVFEFCVITVARSIGYKAHAQTQLVEFMNADVIDQAAMFLTIAIVAPIAEEVIFRGSLQPALAQVAGTQTARLATACVFALLHPPLAWIPMGILGYYLGRVRDAYGRIGPSIAVHALNNAVSLGLYAAVPFVRDAYSPP